MAKTPLMKQYLKAKSEVGEETILLYRVGDFYETFYEDAKRISNILGITLTSRNKELGESIPLAGFPVHALEKYMTKLVESGSKVAIAEQTEDPKKTKTLVKRDIVEIITPGTTLSDGLIDEANYNYLCAIYPYETYYIVAYIDITTTVMYVEKTDKIAEFLLKLSPSEIIISQEYSSSSDILKLKTFLPPKISITSYNPYYFYIDAAKDFVKNYFEINSFQSFGIGENSLEYIIPVSAVLAYIKETKKGNKRYVDRIEVVKNRNFLEIDYSSLRNLELIDPLHSDDKKATLFNVIKRTITPMGTRLLKEYIKKPLIDKNEIEKRFDIVEYFYENSEIRNRLRELLREINDVERVAGKLVYNRVNARDLLGLNRALMVFPKFVEFIKSCDRSVVKDLVHDFPELSLISETISRAIREDAPITVREGKLIKRGYNSDLDEILDVVENSKDWLEKFEIREKEKSNIPKLKVKYNKVFGYFIEVTNSYKDLVPDNYIRKQTLANCERYITEELKEKEDIILNSQDKLNDMEYSIFMDIVELVKKYVSQIQKSSYIIAEVDNYLSFAQVAIENRYVRPKLNSSDKLYIKDGRHPVIEKLVEDEEFISNDTYLDNSGNQIMIITGPNMAGKSTYLRQISLISIMAQMGCFIPAKEADLSIVDKIFTRIGAYDRLAKGQSTFLVEMTEVANILNNATDKSLVLLDEVGRGTSTFDGLSLAWAIVEYLATQKNRMPKTVFATHYHELIDMAEIFKNVVNYNVSIKRDGDRLIFLRKLQSGGVGDSYGIDVARLAGVPESVIVRAREILKKIENFEINLIGSEVAKEKVATEKSELFDTYQIARDSFISKIKQLNIDNMTPIEALNTLYNLKNESKKI